MSDARRVLTVSYGTFSCTLEGFDDSFGTMTAIAAFFRDLAAQDRHFGAVVPPLEPAEQPRDGGMPGHWAPADSAGHVPGAGIAAEDAYGPDGAARAPGTAERAASDMADCVGSAVAAVMPPADDAHAAETLARERPMEAAPGVPPGIEAPTLSAPVRMSETLRRLSDTTMDPVPGSPPVDDLDAAASDETPDEMAPDASADPAVRDVAMPCDSGSEAAETPVAAVAYEAEVPAFDPEPDAVIEPETDAAPESVAGARDAARAGFQGDIAGELEEAEVVEPGGEAGDGPESRDLPGDEAGDAVAPEELPEVPADGPFQLLRMPRDGAGSLDIALPTGDDGASAGAGPDAPEEDTSGKDSPAEDTSADDSPAEHAVAEGGREEDPATSEGATPGVDAAVTRMLSSLAEAEPATPGDMPAPSGATEPDEATEDAPTGHGPAVDAALAPPPAADACEEATAYGRDEPDAGAEAPGHGEQPTGPDPENAVADSSQEAGIPDPCEDTASTGEGLQAEETGDREIADADAGDPDEVRVARLIETTNARLSDPGERRRRSAIAHLRAAVAATRAEGEDTEAQRARAQDESEGPYRADLAALQGTDPTPADVKDGTDLGAEADTPASVVPKRPTAPSVPGVRGARGPARTDEPSPLVLVSEQRIDTAAEAPVRPRRIRRDEEDAALATASPDVTDGEAAAEGAFAAFVRDHGVVEIDDLLECAAAYALDRLGQSEVSHPQLWRMVADGVPGWSELPRETSLRAFGQLQRQGRIRKLRRGAFTVSQASRFRQEARQAAP